MADSQELIQRDLRVLQEFVGIYCRRKHQPAGDELCPQCRDLLEYARQRRQDCPMDPKPKCRDCDVHCYGEPQRSQIREIMRFSGLHLLKHGRLDKLLGMVIGPKAAARE